MNQKTRHRLRKYLVSRHNVRVNRCRKLRISIKAIYNNFSKSMRQASMSVKDLSDSMSNNMSLNN